VNTLGHFLEETVVERIKEPTRENTLWVEGKKAVYKNTENLRFISRFGRELVRSKRTYKVKGERGCYAPLDEKLGMDLYGKYSPLMSYLISFFGGCEAYTPAAKKLSVTLGFVISNRQYRIIWRKRGGGWSTTLIRRSLMTSSMKVVI